MTPMECWVAGVMKFKSILCISLAAVLVMLSSRSTLNSISTLVLASSQAAELASARSSEAGAVDRKPKPTRQLESHSIACLLRLQWLTLSRPVLAGFSARDAEPQRIVCIGDWNSGFDGVQATRPTYLRPSDIAPQGQLPPPSPCWA